MSEIICLTAPPPCQFVVENGVEMERLREVKGLIFTEILNCASEPLITNTHSYYCYQIKNMFVLYTDFLFVYLHHRCSRKRFHTIQRSPCRQRHVFLDYFILILFIVILLLLDHVHCNLMFLIKFLCSYS